MISCSGGCTSRKGELDITFQFLGRNNKTKMSDVDSMFKKLSEDADCKSLLKASLTSEVFESLKEKKTTLGGTLADCIRSGKFSKCYCNVLKIETM